MDITALSSKNAASSLALHLIFNSASFLFRPQWLEPPANNVPL
jgi:hypothetical protein